MEDSFGCIQCDLYAAFFIAVEFQSINQPFELYSFASSLSVACIFLFSAAANSAASSSFHSGNDDDNNSTSELELLLLLLSSALFVIIIISSYHLTAPQLTVDLGYGPPVTLVAVGSSVVGGAAG
jgi:hypothetical protein